MITDSLFFEDKPKNSVLDQNPSPQSKVKEGRVVYITINSTKAPLVNMPNLIDVSYRQAQVMLQSVGLKPGQLIYKPDIAKNVVLEQLLANQNVVPGEKIPKGSTIDLVLGDGLGQGDVSLPDLMGMTLDEARNLLASSSLGLGSVVYQGAIKDSATAVVVRQNPAYAEGVMVGTGQPIDLFLK
jgi:eukaryotic-like serine/threonine-protein kinase